MGPAVTSEVASCEREERLRSTASLSPHNIHPNPLASTGMNGDETVGTVERHGVVPCSSSQPVESPSEALFSSSNGQKSCSRSKVENKLSTSLKPHNVNLVNIKDIQGSQKMSMFIRNNACTMLPNGGTDHLSPSDETKPDQVYSCDETVPCDAALPHLRLVKLGNSCQSENCSAPKNRTRRLIIIPKSQTADDAGKSHPQLNSETFPIGVSDSVKIPENVSPVASDETDSLQGLNSLDEMLVRQKVLNSRASRLLKRLRRLQCREVNSAVKEKLGLLASSLGRAVNHRMSEAAAPKTITKDNTLGNRKLTALSTSELVSYVQKLQSSHHRQGGNVGLLLPTGIDHADAIVTHTVQSGMLKTSGQLLSNMRHLKSAVDSDATESSSGGESGDEERPTAPREASDSVATALSCGKLESNWVKDRSRIVSRWTWLQAQVSDLEYRIRQQSDIYKQLRLSKGSLSLRDPSIGAAASGVSADGDLNGRIKSNKLTAYSENQKISQLPDGHLVRTDGAIVSRDRFSTRAEQSDVAEPFLEAGIKTSDANSPLEKPIVSVSSQMPPSLSHTASHTAPTAAANGLLSTSLSSASTAYDPTCRAARCLELRGLRRRMLLRTAGLHEVSRKASQLSTIRCNCHPPVTPCALCGGRYDRVARIGPTVSIRDRLAIINPSHHSVLSFPQDVSLALRMAESLWTGPSRDDSFTKYSFRPASLRVKNSRSTSSELPQKQDSARQKSADRLQFGRHVPSTVFHGRRSNLRTMETMRKKKRLSMSRKHLSKASLRSSSLKSNRSQMLRRGYLTDAALRRQCSRSTFDINNVVIPSHVVSSARVDVIQYKEIITPKWRKLPKDVGGGGAGGGVADARRGTSCAAKRARFSAASESDGMKKVHWSCDELDSRNFLSSADPGGDETDAEEEIENLSDEAFAARHLRHEIYEKKQCMPINVGLQRRSRSNRSESDSYTFLNPQSPDPGNLDASASLTSSTLSGGPSTSCLGYSDAEDPSHHHFNDSFPTRQPSETKLTRNFSVSSWSAGVSAPHGSEQLSEQPEGRTAPAWPPRTFPLDDSETDRLFTERSETIVDDRGTVQVVRATSPSASMSTDSTEAVDEDPDDPEWTVASRNKDKTGILIKFAKV